tara:strand:- start:102639 stop:103445 length:807 start_codon:yes stop_codon:yes gene_type:complete
MNKESSVPLTVARARALERMLIGTVLLVITLLAWGQLYLMDMSASMALPGIKAPADQWHLDVAVMGALMWSLMMVAMMMPSASPMILTYTRIHQQRTGRGQAVAPTGLFVAGYLGVWLGFSALAATAQWALYHAGLLSAAMGKSSAPLGGVLLILAGAFQFSRLKQACLRICRSPIGFIMTEWREGPTGALLMGIRHGAYCTGCCWALMLLMFVGGVMSLIWMAGLALYFLVEKLTPWPRPIGQLTGLLLIIAGAIMLLSAAFGGTMC